jgi:hypothetical protein
MVVHKARVAPGDTVLVHGAGSGIGVAAIQIARLYGARVITTAGSDDKLARAKALGADVGINYTTADFAAECRALTGKRGVDAVIEHVGGEVFAASIKAVRNGGRIVTCGATAGFHPAVDLRHIFFARSRCWLDDGSADLLGAVARRRRAARAGGASRDAARRGRRGASPAREPRRTGKVVPSPRVRGCDSGMRFQRERTRPLIARPPPSRTASGPRCTRSTISAGGCASRACPSGISSLITAPPTRPTPAIARSWRLTS